MSIGQGDVLATPLQVANTTNVIANGGTLYQPHLAAPGARRRRQRGQGLLAIRQARTVPVDPGNLAIMREAMEWGFEGPWLKWFKIPGLARGAAKPAPPSIKGPPDEQEEPAHPRLVHRLRARRQPRDHRDRVRRERQRHERRLTHRRRASSAATSTCPTSRRTRPSCRPAPTASPEAVVSPASPSARPRASPLRNAWLSGTTRYITHTFGPLPSGRSAAVMRCANWRPSR